MARPITDYKVLTFDCYGTLIDWESGMIAALEPLTSRVGHALSRDEILQAHARHESEQQAQTPAKPYRELLAVVYRRLAEQWGVAVSWEDCVAYGRSVKDWPAFAEGLLQPPCAVLEAQAALLRRRARQREVGIVAGRRHEGSVAERARRPLGGGAVEVREHALGDDGAVGPRLDLAALLQDLERLAQVIQIQRVDLRHGLAGAAAEQRAQQRPEIGGLAQQLLDVLLQDRDGVGARSHALEETHRALVNRRTEHLVLVADQVVDRGDRDVGRLRQRAHREVAVALVADELAGRLQDPIAAAVHLERALAQKGLLRSG